METQTEFHKRRYLQPVESITNTVKCNFVMALVYMITSPLLTYVTGLATQHVITTFTPDPELQQGTKVSSNK
jgi:hypothetical protein